jgi:hypothetical protein
MAKMDALKAWTVSVCHKESHLALLKKKDNQIVTQLPDGKLTLCMVKMDAPKDLIPSV